MGFVVVVMTESNWTEIDKTDCHHTQQDGNGEMDGSIRQYSFTLDCLRILPPEETPPKSINDSNVKNTCKKTV